MQRYDIEAWWWSMMDEGGLSVCKDDNGEWVKYEDVKAKIAEVVLYLENNYPLPEFGPKSNHIISHVLGTLRQLSATHPDIAGRYAQ